jgi:hypothetical protein
VQPLISRGRTPRTSRLAGALAAVVVAIVSISIAVPSADASAPWPATWTAYTFSDGNAISDDGGDNNPGYSDLWSGAPAGQGPLPTTYFATDGTDIFFRIRVADDPETNKGGSFQSTSWLVQAACIRRASDSTASQPA